MQIAMSNTISRTLSKEETGVGMGLFSMLNFISGAIAMSLIGKMLDRESAGFALNPIVTNEAAYVYSNIFVVLCVMIAVAAALYRWRFGAAANVSKSEAV